jgi:TRAP-type C4-dicarboxylate transport system substrate-binding protein
MRSRIVLVLVLAGLVAARARAASDDGREGEPEVTLKMSTVVPEGSPWARESKAFAREVLTKSGGRVRIKWFFNGIAGDDVLQAERIRRGQLDGAATAQMLAEQIAPSVRLGLLPDLFQNREELKAVLSGFQPDFEAEARKAGVVLFGTCNLGPHVFFTRVPVHNMAELRRLKLWRWDLEPEGVAMARELGLQVVPLPLAEASRAYEEGRIDGFIALPIAALAFGWSVQAHYLTYLRISYLPGGVVFAARSLEKLSATDQQLLRAEVTALLARADEAGRQADKQLLGGLLQKQGVTLVPVSESFRAEFFAAAQAARDRMVGKIVPKPLLERVLKKLTEYRAGHGTRQER